MQAASQLSTRQGGARSPHHGMLAPADVFYAALWLVLYGFILINVLWRHSGPALG